MWTVVARLQLAAIGAHRLGAWARGTTLRHHPADDHVAIRPVPIPSQFRDGSLHVHGPKKKAAKPLRAAALLKPVVGALGLEPRTR